MDTNENHHTLQAKTLTLLVRARRMGLHRRELMRLETTGRFRKFQLVAKQAKLSKINEMTEGDRSAPSVMIDPYASITLAISEWRAKHSKHLAREHKRQQTNKAKRERAARRLPPVWSKAKEIDRAPAYARALIETGSAVAFTINFSPDLIERAQKAKEGPFHWLRSRITRRLKDAAGDTSSLTCALDTTKTTGFIFTDS